MKDDQVLLALVGRDVSGKDTVGAYLEKEYGFTQVITGQMVRDFIAEKRLGEATRELMVKVANQAREENGADFFIKRALSLDVDRLLVNGARALGEIQAIREAGGVVIATEAPMEKRYEWSKCRGRASDLVTFDEFVHLEKEGSTNKSASGVNVEAMVQSADFTIQNDQDFQTLFARVDTLMGSLGVEKA